jgi:NPCBM/NEW2 domain-containing protein
MTDRDRRRPPGFATATACVLVLTLGTAASAVATAEGRTLASPKPTQKTLTLTRVNAAQVVSGDKVRFKGAAPGKLVGRRVALQRAAVDGEWVTVDSAKIKDDKSFKLAAVATGVGVNKWRARVKTPDLVHESRTRSTPVFAWFYLSEVDPVDTNRFGDEPAKIGGTVYSRSLMNSTSFWYDDTSWGEWNINYACTQLQAAIGLDDKSATGSEVAFRTYLDGAETNHGTKGLGMASQVVVDVSSRLRLRLESRYVAGPLGSGDTSGYGAWGDARVLCSALPG